MIINLHQGAPSVIPAAPAKAELPAGLFRQAGGRTGSGPWGRAVVLALLVQGALGGLLAVASPGEAPRSAGREEEAVLVYLSSAPPPPPAGVPARVAPAPTPRQARARRPRVPLVAPPVVPPQPPVQEAPPVEEVAASDAPPAVEEEAAVASVGGVVGGVLGGVIGSSAVGGSLGGSGDEALQVSQVARAPELLERVAPRYPRAAKQDGLEGLVVVRVMLDRDGRIEQARTRVVRSVAGLDEAAVAAVHRWRFSPALGRNGRPVRVIVEIPIHFSLR